MIDAGEGVEEPHGVDFRRPDISRILLHCNAQCSARLCNAVQGFRKASARLPHASATEFSVGFRMLPHASALFANFVRKCAEASAGFGLVAPLLAEITEIQVKIL